MAKINTLNYQTVASWNGSQDLFVVEQPDGTKVATPAMVKQFIEAGDFEATGNIEDGDGNQLADIATKLGDPASASGVTGADAFAKISTLNSNVITRTPLRNVGTTFSTMNAALKACYDAIPVDTPTTICFFQSGKWFGTMYRYADTYACAFIAKYNGEACTYRTTNSGSSWTVNNLVN